MLFQCISSLYTILVITKEGGDEEDDRAPPITDRDVTGGKEIRHAPRSPPGPPPPVSTNRFVPSSPPGPPPPVSTNRFAPSSPPGPPPPVSANHFVPSSPPGPPPPVSTNRFVPSSPPGPPPPISDNSELAFFELRSKAMEIAGVDEDKWDLLDEDDVEKYWALAMSAIGNRSASASGK